MLEAAPDALVGPAPPEADLEAERDELRALLAADEPFLISPFGTRDEARVA